MKEKLLALLIAQFSGVRKDGLAQLANALSFQATTDEEAKALVEKLTKDQVDIFVKEFRADVDKEVSESNKTFENNLKKKFDLIEKKNEPNSPKPSNDPDDIQTVIKNAISEAVKPLQERLAGFEKGNVAKSRLQQLNEKLSACNDEAFKAKALKDFSRMNFETDDDFTEYLTDTETDVAAVNQNMSDLGITSQGKPIVPSGANTGKEASEAEISAVMDKIQI